MWHFPGQPKVAFAPATRDSPIATMNVGMMERLSEATLGRFDHLGIPFDEAAHEFVDLLTLHEIGHAYAGVYMTRFSEKWLNEFLATYLAYAFMKARRPQMAQLWEAMNDAIVEASEHNYTALADFERLYVGVGLPNYGWYQGRFQQQGAAVFGESDLTFIHALRASWLETPEVPANDALRLRQLAQIYPGFATWAVGSAGTLE